VRRALRPDSRIYLAPHQSFLLAQDPTWRFDDPIELIVAGSAVRLSMIDPLRRCFPRATVTNMYGQSELGLRIATASTLIDDFSEGDVGLPQPGVRVRCGSTGNLEIDSPFRKQGYTSVTGAPLDTLTDGWPSGDVGTVTADGRVVITGRAAPDINFLGTRVGLDHLRLTVCAVDGVLATERAVRIALSDTIGKAAAAAVVDVVDSASLPDSGKL
jgi:acyl-coenzyme A synthetase/AMP-(fatty) acid ligase